MSFRKPAALAGHCGLFHSPAGCCPAAGFQISSPSSSSSRPRNKRRPAAAARCLATHAAAAAASSRDPPSLDGLPWPRLSDPRRIPTPYEIFGQDRHEPYSKRRFYELVKVYHPDRNHPDLDPAAVAASLERYRLVVAANSILSDPSRRHAYDQHGQGWSRFRADAGTDGGPAAGRYTTYHRWRSSVAEKYEFIFDDDPMYNATWEDWERWYERQRNPNARRSTWTAGFFTARGPQHTVFANNYVFLSIIFALTALGGIGQATRAQNGSLSHRDRMTRRSEEVSRNLMSARDEARSAADDEDDKSARIKRWVRGRDDYAEGEVDGRTDDPDGLCNSGLVKDRDRDPYWKRQPEPWER